MKVEELRDVMRFLERHYSEDHRALELKGLRDDPSKYGDFFRNLVSNPLKKDPEIAKNIYKGSFPRTRYKKLKSTFTSRALNTITFLGIEGSNLSDFTKAVYKCYKNLFFISTLLRLGGRNSAISLAKKTLILSERFELHHVSIELLQQLRNHAVLMGKKTDFNKYAQRQEAIMGALQSESHMQALAQRLGIHSAQSTYIDETLVTEAGHALKVMKSELQKHNTFLNNMTLFRTENMYHQYAGFPSESITSCDHAIAYLNTKPQMSPKLRTGEFVLNKLENYMLMRDYSHSEEMIPECAKYIAEGTNLWFNYNEFSFLFAIHTAKFPDALNVYNAVANHTRFEAQPVYVRERWKIFKLFLDYLRDRDKRIQPGEVLKRSNLMRRQQYAVRIKEFPTYSKDSRGMNVAMLMLNILILLENERQELVIEQLDALSTYRFTHLHGKNSGESAILFQLIKLMDRYNYDYPTIVIKAKRLEEKLRITKPSIGELKECVQIIPPQWLWSHMKEAMEANWKKEKRYRKKKVSYIGS